MERHVIVQEARDWWCARLSLRRLPLRCWQQVQPLPCRVLSAELGSDAQSGPVLDHNSVFPFLCDDQHAPCLAQNVKLSCLLGNQTNCIHPRRSTELVWFVLRTRRLYLPGFADSQGALTRPQNEMTNMTNEFCCHLLPTNTHPNINPLLRPWVLSWGWYGGE